MVKVQFSFLSLLEFVCLSTLATLIASSAFADNTPPAQPQQQIMANDTGQQNETGSGQQANGHRHRHDHKCMKGEHDEQGGPDHRRGQQSPPAGGEGGTQQTQ